MQLNDALALAPAAAPYPGRAAEQEVLVDLHELFVPKVLLVEDVGRVDLGGDAACEVLDALAAVPALDGRVVTVSLGIGLLQERQPGLLWVLALCEVLSGSC